MADQMVTGASPEDEGLPEIRSETGGVPARHETASAAMSSQARARVEARYVMALRRPRDMDTVRVGLLKECKRPTFAEVAIYRKPVGRGFVEGPSIRFAEAAVRAMGNIDVDTPVLYEDDIKRIVRVTVTDLEANATYSTDITVRKIVERKRVKKGQTVLGTRENSYGEMVYIVEASEDELQIKTAALVSKAVRNNALRLLPGDIKDECVGRVKATLRDRDAKDPDAARKRIIDGFDGVHVQPMQLKEYLGHDIDQCSPAELEELRGIFAAIRDGEATWTSVMEARREERAEKRQDGKQDGSAAGKGRAAKTKDLVREGVEKEEAKA